MRIHPIVLLVCIVVRYILICPLRFVAAQSVQFAMTGDMHLSIAWRPRQDIDI
jgi:hypothetical protein